jgi:hypothetical protein
MRYEAGQETVTTVVDHRQRAAIAPGLKLKHPVAANFSSAH